MVGKQIERFHHRVKIKAIIVVHLVVFIYSKKKT